MIHSEHISIGKLRQAYRLNTHDADVLLSALASQHCLDLYALWREAVRFVDISGLNCSLHFVPSLMMLFSPTRWPLLFGLMNTATLRSGVSKVFPWSLQNAS